MDEKIFAIYDAKAEAYMQPFFVQAQGVATREFDKLCNDAEHPIGQHPEDYTLFLLGTWNKWEGHMEACVPKACGNGLDYKRQQQ